MLNKEEIKILTRLVSYTDRYEINIQFWPSQTSVFIGKDYVDLTSFGGERGFALQSALDYLDRINKVSRS